MLKTARRAADPLGLLDTRRHYTQRPPSKRIIQICLVCDLGSGNRSIETSAIWTANIYPLWLPQQVVKFFLIFLTLFAMIKKVRGMCAHVLCSLWSALSQQTRSPCLVVAFHRIYPLSANQSVCDPTVLFYCTTIP